MVLLPAITLFNLLTLLSRSFEAYRLADEESSPDTLHGLCAQTFGR